MSCQGRGSLKGAITAFIPARPLNSLSLREAHRVPFAYVLFTIILSSHAVLGSC